MNVFSVPFHGQMHTPLPPETNIHYYTQAHEGSVTLQINSHFVAEHKAPPAKCSVEM